MLPFKKPWKITYVVYNAISIHTDEENRIEFGDLSKLQ